jgi:hypothetical protein
VAAFERLLWLSVNSRLMGVYRPSFNAFAFVLLSLIRRWLALACEFPQPQLAHVLRAAAKAENQFVLEAIGALVVALERTASGAALELPLREALDKFALWLDVAAKTLFQYDGGRNCLVGGVRIGKMAERMVVLASGDPLAACPGTTPPHRRAALINLDRIPAAKSKVKKTAPQPRSKAKTLALRPLDSCAPLASSIFGDKAIPRLGLRELTFDGVALLESQDLPAATAAKYLAGTTTKGVARALISHSLADAPPRATDIREALSASRDDEAFRDWLRREVTERADEFAAVKS